MLDSFPRYAYVCFVALILVACGKEGGSSAVQKTGQVAAAGAYGQEDGKCFAGIIRKADEKRITPAGFENWKNRLGSQDRRWVNGFTGFYTVISKVVLAHMFKTPKELYDAKLLDSQQREVMEGYLEVYNESDKTKADSAAAKACVNIGFSPGANLD